MRKVAIFVIFLLLSIEQSYASEWIAHRAKSHVGQTAQEAGMKRTRLWCSEFARMVTGRSDVDDRARSWLARPRTSPRTGVIAVMRRGGDPRNGHVAIVLAVTPTSIVAISGNQNGRVGIGRYPLSRVLAFVEP